MLSHSVFDKFTRSHPLFSVALSSFIGALLLFFFLWLTLFFGLRTAAAQGVDECVQYPVRGSTTFVFPGNSGVFYFQPADLPPNISKKIYFAPASQRVCAHKTAGSDMIQLKGWVWNDNFGWASFYCPGAGGNNLGVFCGDQKYGVKIDKNGNFSGYAWSNAGWIRFNCLADAEYKDGNHCPPSSYKAQVDLTKVDVNGYTLPFGSANYAISGNVGWLNFKGILIPVSADPIIPEDLEDKDKDGKPDAPVGGPGSPGGAAGGNGQCSPGDVGCPFGCTPDEDGDGSCVTTPALQCPGNPLNPLCPINPPPDCDDKNATVNPWTPEIVGDGTDNDCDGVEEDGKAKNYQPLSDLGADVGFNRPNYTGNLVHKSADGGVSVGTAVRSDIRNVLYRNVQQLKRGASTQCGTLGIMLSFQPQDDVYYCDPSLMPKDKNGKLKEDLVIGPVTSWTGRKTLVVEDLNVFIDGDIYSDDEDAQFGIIVLRKNLNDKTKGNVYIGPKVRNLRLQLYADGSMLPAVLDDAGRVQKSSNQQALKKGFSDIKWDHYKPGSSESFFGQLLLQGLFITHNTVDQYFDKKYYDGYGKNLLDGTTVGANEGIDGDVKAQAQMYSLGYLRSLPKKPPLKDPKKDPNDQKNINKATDGTPCALSDDSSCAGSWKDYFNPAKNPQAPQEDGFISSKLKKIDPEKIYFSSAVFIIYEAPADDLPGFTNITSGSAVQKPY